MAGGKITGGVIEQGGARNGQWMNNLALRAATTTNANDSIRITGSDGTALSTSNYGWITLPSTVTAGQLVTFSVTADVTILLTGAHWNIGTTGDVTGALLRVLAINDNGTLRWGVAKLGGRNTLLTTDTSATATDINLAEEVLCTAAVASSSNTCREVGWFRANFDDTGGAAEDLWAIQGGLNDVNTGTTADGYWQPWNPAYTGFSADPTNTSTRWSQIGRTITAYAVTVVGTSNATTFTSTLPVSAFIGQSFPAGSTVDGGSTVTVATRLTLSTGSTTITHRTTMGLGAWTNSGTKEQEYVISFEVGPAASFIE